MSTRTDTAPAERAPRSVLDLRPIGLDELTARAALLTRTDRKYLVPTDTARRLVAALGPRLRVLDIDGRRAFRYRSTYYDTEALEAFHGAATGRRRRYKVRRRDYLDTGTSFLEVKTRTGRGDSSKQRIELTGSESDLASGEPDPVRIPGHRDAEPASISAQARAFVESALSAADCTAPSGPLLPVLHTTYDRTTLLVEDEGSRLTVDAELTWWDPRDADLRRGLEDLLVIETKGGTRPGAADRLLWSLGHRPVRLSKYGTGMGLLRPELPGNRWHRTLGRVDAAA
ncbi:polyphosphate polymerase domain-containing protein [Brachybacterium sp. AOP25-B2-12]|uniref:polyphosphate polymerase domain-containing protein n=1 Tax=Brachybacterium sp. AOP25-B2-12 TaxID=3457710 RepID=UPI0040338D1A